MSSLPQRRESPRVPAPRSWSGCWLLEMLVLAAWALWFAVAGYWLGFAFMMLFGLYWAKNGDPQ